MKVNGDKIVIESRREIDDIMDMINLYIKDGKPKYLTNEELEAIKNQLDVLYMTW